MSSNLLSRLISICKAGIVVILISLPGNAAADYYLVYGPPEPPAVCNFCERAVYHHPVHRYHYSCKHKYHKYYPRVAHRRYSHYSITVYYPVPTYIYSPPPCSSCCCGGWMAPTYFWVPTPARVYYSQPNDVIVGNRYEDNYYDPSLDTGTADNDIY